MSSRYKLLFAVFLAVLFPAVAPAAPRMELSPDSWNFGEIFQWTNPSIEITIKNTGDEDLKIQDVKASCGCTPVMLSDKTVKPGGTGQLRIEFASYNQASGRVKKEVLLVTNDPAAPRKSIIVRGVVKEDKAAMGYVEPRELDFGVIAPYETKFFVMNIRNKGNNDIPVSGVLLP